ncbi:LptF/LptG family permease [Cytophagales bacterium LB-30]|uniref:LptF/LptG family permease n=1 Tax=Shiella aurantiaca TaxID=3058365 RepID=A0ABT8F834_9BACT|nr:LptF/LptG family permease [Shiella aurantiaca]MDN4166553.1 LptF/LptG family permease [Shiella aurantiaca]
MKILDRYILKKFLTTFIYVVLMLVAIIIVIDITEKNDKYLRHGLALGEILNYYAAFIPFITNLITPITVFIATVFVTSKLAAHTEIIAMLSGGVSFRRLMVPYLIGASIIAVCYFYLNSYVIPDANKTRIVFENTYLSKPFYFDERNIHIKVAPNSYVFMESYNNKRDVGYKFSIETIEGLDLKEKLTAKKIEWDTAVSKWKITDWNRRRFDGLKEIVSSGQSLDTALSITPADFGNTKGLHEALTLTELNEYMDELRSRGADNVNIYQIEEYIRYMAPFSVIILTLIGLIVSARKARGGTGFQIALGFVIAFVFIIFFILSRAIAESNSMNPILAVWIPNIVFSLVGVLLYKTVPR